MSSTIKHQSNTATTAGTGTESTTIRNQEQVVTGSKARMVLAVGRIVSGSMFLVGLRRQVVRPRFRHPD